jgi:transglutaminase-like putative cysteine protease
MQFKKSLVIVFVFLSFLNINAQEFKLGKVTIAELEEKVHPKDSSAVAAMLFNNGNVRFEYIESKGLMMILEVKTKIKIYKKEGYDWANKAVSRYIGTDGETVNFSDAATYNLVDGKVVKTKLDKNGEFDEKINKYYGKNKIVLPNVKEGSIIEYSYTLRSKSIADIRDWYFQASIPVNHSEYDITILDYLTYNKQTKGYIYPKITSENAFNQQSRTKFVLENIPAMKDENFVNNIDNYKASVSYELAMINIPGKYYKTFSSDWASVTKTIYENDSFGAELNKTGYFEDNINALIKGLRTKDEKISAIFNYVKSSVKWNDYTGYSCNDGVKNAYKDKTGNVAEINLMLTAMLRFAGLDANPVLVSTRENGIALFPSRTAFNYVIAAVETPEGLILLDATEKYAEPNVLPLRDLNWFGRLIRKDGTSTQVDLEAKTLSIEASYISVVLNSDGSVSGKIRRQLTDHEALEFRKKNITTSNEIYLEELESKNNNIEINDYVRENESDLSKPIMESYSFIDTKDIEMINDKIYISPMLFMSTKENPFKQEVREYPIDFGYPFQKKYNFNMQIPEGYVVESMPEPINIGTGENLGTFKYIIGNSGNTIQVSITTTINTALLAPDYYEILKGFYQQIIDKQNEKIILSRI